MLLIAEDMQSPWTQGAAGSQSWVERHALHKFSNQLWGPGRTGGGGGGGCGGDGC